MENPQFEAVKRNMLNMLSASKKEFSEYKKTKDIVLLQQSGEKLFNTLENYIQFVNEIQVMSFYELKKLVKEKSLRKLLFDARDLHRFFYKGELESDEDIIVDLYESVEKRIEERTRRL